MTKTKVVVAVFAVCFTIEAFAPTAHYKVISTAHADPVAIAKAIVAPEKPTPKVDFPVNVCTKAMMKAWPAYLWHKASLVTGHENGRANPTASNINKNNEGTDHGCFQINDKYHPEFSVAKLADPLYNAQAAYKVYQNRIKSDGIGWSAWYAVQGILW